MAFQEKQIGQISPANTTAVSLYSPPANTVMIVRTIFICNTDTSNHKFRIFHDDDGKVYDTTSALFYDVTIPGNCTREIHTHIAMNNSNGNLGVRSDSASNLTFTGYGMEVS